MKQTQRWTAVLCLCGACVLEATGGAPLAPVDASAGANSSLSEDEDGTTTDVGGSTATTENQVEAENSSPETGGASASGTSASGGTSHESGGENGSQGAAGPSSSSASSATDACSITIATCDPVENIGCLGFLGQQCIVDREATIASGRCVFIDTTTVPDAGACAEDILRTTCGPGETCLDGACQKLCTCDSHCETGSCCTQSASPHAGDAIKYCGECP